MAVSFTMLKTKWSYFMEYGSFRWYTIDPTCLFTVNRPSLQYNSFMDGQIVQILKVSRNTLLLGLNTETGDLLQLQYLAISFWTLYIADFVSLATAFI